MYRSLEYGDTARVINPTDPVEYRLGTVTDVCYPTPHTTYARHYTLRFPTGDQRTYPAANIRRATRADDRAALEAALTSACVAVREACHIAHDFDPDLSAGTASLLRRLVDLATLRLGLTLGPANPARPLTHHQEGGDQ
ncbi:hypothetical protein [Micromonospora rifamycinica]|uniref:Uncharacterized protein n=1 Tax=Micromonospora rifamycinica TaxID=291594 RepID=A0A109IMM2_9ACTN|nr:hypothetical protein [Micromonospora rifamycinica]KWV33318.1 hypothetical protein AWV63_07600 [Micromonospora rifamycinica]SCG81565.1 hypothetical protein GA0070623_5949 [Micromonospora rifamycinica]